MNLPIKCPHYTAVKATKADKKDLMRFYKAQRYSASFIGQDQGYFIKVADRIIACALVSAGQENGDYWLLHAIVVDKAHRGKGMASLLLRTIMSEEKGTQPTAAEKKASELIETTQNATTSASYAKIICFADLRLQPFYLSNNFVIYNTRNEIAQLPHEFQQRLLRYRQKQSDLYCYLYCAVN